MRLVPLVLIAACNSPPSSPETAACDLTGQYRLRFTAVGQRMWLRFRVENSGGRPVGTLTKPIALPSDGPLDVTPGAGCSFEVAIRSRKRGPTFARVELDPVTNRVSGVVRGQDARWGDLQLTGVRDLGEPASAKACVKPGRYRLTLPNEQEWVASNRNEDCAKASLTMPFLVEYVGDELVIDQLDDDGNAAWAGEDVAQDLRSECAALVRFRHHRSRLAARLEFAGDQVTAKAIEPATVEIEDRGGAWRCTASDPMLWVERAPR